MLFGTPGEPNSGAFGVAGEGAFQRHSRRPCPPRRKLTIDKEIVASRVAASELEAGRAVNRQLAEFAASAQLSPESSVALIMRSIRSGWDSN